MTWLNYLILVVIYNRSLKEAESICSLVKSAASLPGSTVLVWDNSANAQRREQMSWLYDRLSGVNVLYKHSPENKSLSEIYNSFLAEVSMPHEFIMLLDHDTSFDSGFFEAHELARKNNDFVNLYLPQVFFKDEIVSPIKQCYYKSLPYGSLVSGVHSSKNNTAINSGMLIRSSYFTTEFAGYDPRLKFYGTDDYFMMEYRKSNDFFYTLDYIIQHDLTCSPDSGDVMKFRDSFNDAQEAFLILHSNGRRFSIAGLVVFLRRVKHTLTFKVNFFKT